MKDNYLNTQSSLAMKGAGYYSAKTAGAKTAIDKTLKVIENALKTIPSTEILKFADFGSADGGTSQEMWFNVIKLIREKGDDRQIEILYTDLASNDFSTLFKTMQGMHGNSQFAFQHIFSNVYVHGCGTGFHQQLMANNSLTLGFSATAMHYVSERPCLIENHVHMTGANEREKQLFKDQANHDWETILLNRSKEMINGGRFICINFGIDEKGRCLGNTGGHVMFNNFAKHWKHLENQGLITNQEFINATFTQHYRTLEEFKKPFENKDSVISKSGLVLKSCETMITDCPYKIHYLKNKDTMSSAEYARTLIPTMRSWSETVFKNALIDRSENEINEIVNKFYDLYIEEVSNDPEGHAMDYVHVIMDIEKIS
ncbi:MAG: SAM-dependent methyltransferase [Alphaproteobacteria bacterium]